MHLHFSHTWANFLHEIIDTFLASNRRKKSYFPPSFFITGIVDFAKLQLVKGLKMFWGVGSSRGLSFVTFAACTIRYLAIPTAVPTTV